MQTPKESNSITKNSIPVGGTLGILAYGYRGIMAWRQVRNEAYNAHLKELQKKANEKKLRHLS